MATFNHLAQSKELYQKAKEEFEKAQEKKDGDALRNACAKGWLSAIEATYAYLAQKGVKEEELPKGGDRGRRFMVNKYFEKELRPYYFFLRDQFHIEGYYEGSLDFDEVATLLDDLNLYIEKIVKLTGGHH